MSRNLRRKISHYQPDEAVASLQEEASTTGPDEAVASLQEEASTSGHPQSDSESSIGETLAEMRRSIERAQDRCGDFDEEDDSDYVQSNPSSKSSEGSEAEMQYEVEIEKANVTAEDIDMNSSARKSRKRMRDPAKWTRSVLKERRQRGLDKVAPIGITLCKESCKQKCSEKLSDDQRKQIFDYYYSLDQQGKDVQLFHCISAIPPGRKRPGADRHHHMSYKFAVKVGEGDPIAICKEALCTLHGVSRKVVDRVKESIGQPGPSSTTQGKHNNRPNRIKEKAVQYIKQHISSFPAESSHYSRHQNPNRMYLSANLSLNKMHALYKESCEKDKVPSVCLNFYREVFVTQFNLGFGSPKTDVCKKCDGCEEVDLTEHKASVKLAIDEMANDRQAARADSNRLYFTFDLQKTMPLPKIPTSIAFYLRQLWFYNCGIHIVTKDVDNGYHFNWTENEAGRGCEEICSCILAFVEATADIPARHAITWSDSCAGQNKNFTVVTLWQYMLSTGRFDVIDHKFPEVGHSFMDSDRDFALIEKQLRKTERVYMAEEYRTLIRQCKQKPPFVVHDVSNGLIAAKQLAVEMRLKKTIKNTAHESVQFRDIRWIRTTRLGFFAYKHSFSEVEPWKEVDIRGRRFSTDVCIDLKRLHKPPGHKVATKKIADIQQQLPYIMSIYRPFYENLVPGNDADDSDEEEF